VNQITLAQKVYEYIREGIIDNRYRQGEPLYEAVLSEELSISRTPVREALKMLHKEGLVSIYPRRGAHVNTIDLNALQEIFQIRELLEPILTEAVTPYISINALSRIESKLLSIKEKYEETKNLDVKKARSIGEELHTLIFDTFGNKRLIQILNDLTIERERGCYIATKTGEGKAILFLEQHLGIIAALKERKAEKAKELAAQHVASAKKSLLSR
jgi:GntR family transcriptional regulator, rspAB operon transcriptional repressor